MPYIGNTPADKFLTLAKQNFSTSATTSYTLDSAVSSTQDIALFINSERQSPVDAYSVSATALTLTSATAGTDEMYCVYLGKTVGTVSPASDSVTTAMIQSNAVTGAKLNTDVISAQTALGATPADTDELLVSDAGVLKRVDYSYLKSVTGTNLFHATMSANQSSVSANTWTKALFNTDTFDTDNVFDTSNNRFIAPVAGKYFFVAKIYMFPNSANGTKGYSRFYKNGSGLSLAVEVSALGGSNPYLSEFTMNNTTIVDLAQNDYIEFFGRFDTGSGTISFDKSESYFAGFRIK